jgi:hypothetical protein
VGGEKIQAMKNAAWTGDLGRYGLFRADGVCILYLYWEHDEYIKPHWEVHLDRRVIKLVQTARHFDAVDFAKEEAIKIVRADLKLTLEAIEESK